MVSSAQSRTTGSPSLVTSGSCDRICVVIRVTVRTFSSRKRCSFVKQRPAVLVSAFAAAAGGRPTCVG